MTKKNRKSADAGMSTMSSSSCTPSKKKGKVNLISNGSLENHNTEKDIGSFSANPKKKKDRGDMNMMEDLSFQTSMYKRKWRDEDEMSSGSDDRSKMLKKSRISTEAEVDVTGNSETCDLRVSDLSLDAEMKKVDTYKDSSAHWSEGGGEKRARVSSSFSSNSSFERSIKKKEKREISGADLSPISNNSLKELKHKRKDKWVSLISGDLNDTYEHQNSYDWNMSSKLDSIYDANGMDVSTIRDCASQLKSSHEYHTMKMEGSGSMLACGSLERKKREKEKRKRLDKECGKRKRRKLQSTFESAAQGIIKSGNMSVHTLNKEVIFQSKTRIDKVAKKNRKSADAEMITMPRSSCAPSKKKGKVNLISNGSLESHNTKKDIGNFSANPEKEKYRGDMNMMEDLSFKTSVDKNKWRNEDDVTDFGRQEGHPTEGNDKNSLSLLNSYAEDDGNVEENCLEKYPWPLSPSGRAISNDCHSISRVGKKRLIAEPQEDLTPVLNCATPSSSSSVPRSLPLALSETEGSTYGDSNGTFITPEGEESLAGNVSMTNNSDENPLKRKCRYCLSYMDSSLLHDCPKSLPPSEEKEEFYCFFCSKKYVQRSHLNHHVRTTHMGVRNYKCHLCSMKFGCKQSLVVHNRFKHDRVLMYECKICTKKFPTSSNLYRHYVKVHSMAPIHCCTMCPCSYSFPSDLENHKIEKHSLQQS